MPTAWVSLTDSNSPPAMVGTAVNRSPGWIYRIDRKGELPYGPDENQACAHVLTRRHKDGAAAAAMRAVLSVALRGEMIQKPNCL